MNQTNSHHAAIASVLLAGDIQARVVSNSESQSIEVKLVDDSRVLWNGSSGNWGYSLIRPESVETEMTTLAEDAEPSEVATLIATTEYPAPLSYPLEPQDDL